MKSAFEELMVQRDTLLTAFSAGKVSESFNENYTEVMDHYFRRAHQDSKVGQRLFKRGNPFAFVAVGGYGRRELCLQSDIDMVMLFGAKIPAKAKALAKEIFYHLWDLGLDLGYGVRNIKDCLALCREDFKVLSSMVDSRFICGDSPLYLKFMGDLQRKVITKKAAAFGRWLENQDRIRGGTYGDASHLLEPHIKEGIGGLRDYHHMLWMGKVFFNTRIPQKPFNKSLLRICRFVF